MSISPQAAGFVDGVHGSQQAFRQVLNALSHPGDIETLDVDLTPPDGLSVASSAVCLTLFDLDVKVWLQPGLPQESQDWLVFHTGCRLTEKQEQADFAVIWERENVPDLSKFNQGTPEYPEASTTLLVQVNGLSQGMDVSLRGPGILEEKAISPLVSPRFWHQWQLNYQKYPLGVDVLCLSSYQVLGLPRSVQVNF